MSECEAAIDRHPLGRGRSRLCGPVVDSPGFAVAMLAPGPAAGPPPAFAQLFLCPPDAPLARGLVLGVLDPTDELVASQRRDVLPELECRGVGPPRVAQVLRELMYPATGHRLVGHRRIV